MKRIEELTNGPFHFLVDASKQAYGAVVNARSSNSDGKFHSNLVTSKTKVSPVQEITLPRVELLAAVIGARLLHHIRLHLCLPKDVKTSFLPEFLVFLH